MSRRCDTLLAILAAALVALPASAKKEPPKLFPPDGLSAQDEDRAMDVCAHEAWESVALGDLPSPSAEALARMGGRSSRDFLWFSVMRGIAGYPNEGVTPMEDTEGHHPVGSGKAWSRDSRKQNISDRYVLCLLAMGFRWADEPSPPPRPSPSFEPAAPSQPGPPAVRDPLVIEGIDACRAGDHAMALSRFVAAAEKGDAEGQFLAGNLLLSPKPGVELSVAPGLGWLRKAADQGNTEASFLLALVYKDGDQVARDLVEGVRWATKAARGGHPGGQTTLGIMYRYGLGVPVDYAEALSWQRLAAGQGNVFGLENLGLLYQLGLGVEKDRREACHLYGVAAQRGYGPCQVRIAWCLSDAQGVPHDTVLALAWYEVLSETLPPESEQAKKVIADRNRVAVGLSDEQVLEAAKRAEEIRSRLTAIPIPDGCADPNAARMGGRQ